MSPLIIHNHSQGETWLIELWKHYRLSILIYDTWYKQCSYPRWRVIQRRWCGIKVVRYVRKQEYVYVFTRTKRYIFITFHLQSHLISKKTPITREFITLEYNSSNLLATSAIPKPIKIKISPKLDVKKWKHWTILKLLILMYAPKSQDTLNCVCCF